MTAIDVTGVVEMSHFSALRISRSHVAALALTNAILPAYNVS